MAGITLGMTDQWKPPEDKPLVGVVKHVCPKCKRPKASDIGTMRSMANRSPSVCVIEDGDACRHRELMNLREEVVQLKQQLLEQKQSQDIARRSRVTSTHTFAVLDVTEQTMAEVEGKLRAAEYDHAFSVDNDCRMLIDMHGIALRKGD